MSYVHVQTLYQVHLSRERLNCNAFLSDVTRTLLASCDAVNVDTLRLKMALLPGHETSDVAILLKDVETSAMDVKKAARTVSPLFQKGACHSTTLVTFLFWQIKHRIPQALPNNQSPLSFGDDVTRSMNESVESLSSIARMLHIASKQAVQQVAVLTGLLHPLSPIFIFLVSISAHSLFFFLSFDQIVSESIVIVMLQYRDSSC